MKQTLFFILVLLAFSVTAKEYHVAKSGNDNNEGTNSSPFLRIQAAANLAKAGDVIIVHKGVYREKIIPRRGGTSDENRIVYRAAEGEKVEVKGSEQIKSWERYQGSVWKVTIPNEFFGDYNPYVDLVRGDWFNDKGRVHHTGEVYLNEKALWEMESLTKVLNPKAFKENYDPTGSTYTWYCESDENNTYIYANFHESDPNKELVEINVRQTCFYPEENFINYITVSGFHLSQAATQWAPPTAEQKGLIGTNWSKGWIIEDNVIRNSKCSGLTLGKYGDEYDNTSENSAEGYVETIKRALNNGWHKDHIGSHIVRNNIISDCEQTGICGSMGAVFSTIENNDIYNIWTKRMWTGAEMGGIKIHASIDMLIKDNRLSNCGRGLWLDWMCQGCRVSGNLLYGNTTDDLFVEVNHGPFLIENNILLSPLAIRDWSEGGAYVHNLIAGTIEIRPQKRSTPYQVAHGTDIAGLAKTKCGDNRYYNNIFLRNAPKSKNSKSGLQVYENTEHPMHVDGNVYLNGAHDFSNEKNKLVPGGKHKVKVTETPDGVYLQFDSDPRIRKMKNKIICSDILGETLVSRLGFVNPDDTPLTIDKDYLGNTRDKINPTAGPFEDLPNEEMGVRVWSYKNNQ